jgi:hypothetical protein
MLVPSKPFRLAHLYDTWGLYYKTFYDRNEWSVLVSQQDMYVGSRLTFARKSGVYLIRAPFMVGVSLVALPAIVRPKSTSLLHQHAIEALSLSK